MSSHLRTRNAVLLGAGAVVSATVLFATILVYKPGWIFNSTTLPYILSRLPSTYRPAWDSLLFSVRSVSLEKKEFQLSAVHVCLSSETRAESLCFKNVELAGSATFSLRSPPEIVLTRCVLLGDRIHLTDAAAAAAPGSPLAMIPSYLSVRSLFLDVPSLEISRRNEVVRGRLRVIVDPRRPRAALIDALWRRGPGGLGVAARLSASVDSDSWRSINPTWISARGEYVSGAVRIVFSAASAGKRNGTSAIRVLLRAASPPYRLSVALSGQRKPQETSLVGEVLATAASGPVRGIRWKPVSVVLRPATVGGAAPRAIVKGRYQIKIASAAAGSWSGIPVPDTVAGAVHLDLRSTPTMREADHFNANLIVSVDDFDSWFKIGGDVRVFASGRAGDPASAVWKESATIRANVARFQDIVTRLAATTFAVPAPLTALDGPLSVYFRENGDSATDRRELRIRIDGDLKAPPQRLSLHVAGDAVAHGLMTSTSTVIGSVDIILGETALQLPHLDVLRMPALMPDPRIISSQEVAPVHASPTFAFNAPGIPTGVRLAIHLKTSSPALLYTDLARAPVPISLDLASAPPYSQYSGTVTVRSFPVSFFRRAATVEHLSLLFRPGAASAALDGLIRYPAAEAMIMIRLNGTMQKPQVVFDSEPPLSQDEIIAMLLFGKSSIAFDADQASTLATVRTGISERAFGLASLYLFASTPLQFVGYDPAAKAYSLRFAIPGGETLEVNSAADQSRRIQLRKRLSTHFAIATQAQSSPTQANAVTTFLEWFARY